MSPHSLTRSNHPGTLSPVPEVKQAAESLQPVRCHGKFFFTGKEKFYVKGITYGPFKPEADGCEYHDPARVKADFPKMAAWGINTVRVYTIPPRWFLDAAQEYGLRVMIGIPWEQHVTFLDSAVRKKNIERKVIDAVRACSGHPAVFAYALGNEIPGPIVRWYGRKKIENFIKRLYHAGKSTDPRALFTYVNYPTTEYLQLPFLDFICFNVYLETKEKLEAYLYRLQNLSGDKPLLMAELGLDSRRNGEERQAQTLNWQARAAFHTGCAGLFIFSWTDEWFRGGAEIDDWDFGLVRRDGSSKAALSAVAETYKNVPFNEERFEQFRISVVVCTYNGSRTLRDCLEGLSQIEYPNFEVIIVNDGSKDKTEEIAKEFSGKYGFRLISTPNRGLSNARNMGMEAATGEIVAYTDDDARPDPHWLHYLAYDFLNSGFDAVGGPNIPPPGDGLIAECVANSPGGPAHVLVCDRTAEHIPGCNMAFRKAALQEAGGFDPQFRTAGDDVDACWRILEKGKIGFSASAMVWHHRRNSLKMYWKQQYGYGKAEALLEDKWPGKFNGPGHMTWGGRVYNKGLTLPLSFQKGRIYQGSWGLAPFQSIYHPAPSLMSSLALMPEWYFLIGILAILSGMGFIWKPFVAALPLLILAVGVLFSQAVFSASRASFTEAVPYLAKGLRFRLRLLTAFMHLMQPLARLCGRIDHGLTFWRRVGPSGFALPVPRQIALWNETWKEPAEWLRRLKASCLEEGFIVFRGGNYDHWDLQVRSGMFGSARISLVSEEHGSGKQQIRIRWFPVFSSFWSKTALFLLGLSAISTLQNAWPASAIFTAGALIIVGRMLRQCSCAMAGVKRAVELFKS